MLQQQLQQVTAQRSQLAAHAAQLQSAMQQLHNSPPLLNGGAGIAASGASGSPADSLQTYSGGVSKPSKPPAGKFATYVYIFCISHAVLDQAGLQVWALQLCAINVQVFQSGEMHRGESAVQRL